MKTEKGKKILGGNKTGKRQIQPGRRYGFLASPLAGDAGAGAVFPAVVLAVPAVFWFEVFVACVDAVAATFPVPC